MLALGLAGLVLGLAAVGWVAVDGQGKAQAAAAEANYSKLQSESRRLAAISREVRVRYGDEKAAAVAWLGFPHDGNFADSPLTDEASSAIYTRSALQVMEFADHLLTRESPSTHFAISVSHDGKGRVWRSDSLETVAEFAGVTPGESRQQFDEKPKPVVEFTPDGRSLVLFGFSDRRVRVFDVARKTFVTTVQLPAPSDFGADAYQFAAVSAQANRIVLVDDTRTARVFDVASGALVTTYRPDSLDGYEVSFNSAVLSPSGRLLLLSIRSDKTGISDVVDIGQKERIAQLDTNSYVGPFIFDPSERFLYLKAGFGESYYAVYSLYSQFRGMPDRRAIEPSDYYPNDDANAGDVEDMDFDFVPPDFSFKQHWAVEHIDASSTATPYGDVLDEDPSLYDSETDTVRPYNASVVFPAMWAISSRRIERHLGIASEPFAHISFSPSLTTDRAIGAVTDEGCPRYYDLVRRQSISALAPGKACRFSWLSANGQLAFVEVSQLEPGGSPADEDWTLKVYRIEPETPTVATAGSSLGPVASDGVLLVTPGDDGPMQLWDRGLAKVWETGEQGASMASVALYSGSALFAAGDWSGRVTVGDLATGRRKWVLQSHDGGVPSLAFSQDGKSLVSGGHDAAITVIDIATGKQAARLMGHKATISSLEFSPSGDLLASASLDGTVRVWPGGNEIATLKHQGPVFSAHFSPDGSRLATASEDGLVRIWKSDQLDLATEGQGHEALVRGAVWSADSRLVLSWSDDRTARLWTRDGQAVRNFVGHSGAITHAIFTDDARLAITGDTTGQIRIWDVETGNLLSTRQAGQALLRSLSFAAKERILTVVSDSGQLFQWSIAPGGLRERIDEVGATTRALQPLSATECAQFYLTSLTDAAVACKAG